MRELLEDQFGVEEIEGSSWGAPLVRTITVLTLANVLFLGAASVRGLHFMESAEFCGTACHSVMSPEWTTYQASPHARVACVECHVGEGVEALVQSKLQGAWQMVSATFDLYERPIPTPVHELRPARETCEKCHWPDKIYGNRLKTIVRYQNDEPSTPIYTTLSIKIDALGRAQNGVHWHIAKGNEVRYASIDDERQQMIWVEALQSDGSWKRFEDDALIGRSESATDERDFDCVDCHNRATHIYERPDFAVDDRIRIGSISRELPFVKREGLAAIQFEYPNAVAAMDGIDSHMRGYYRRNYPQEFGGMTAAIDEAVETLQGIYNRNIHHRMKIGWNAYPSMLGHQQGDGCFRCHNQKLRSVEGDTISDDCTLCHSMLANAENEPFLYLREPAEGQRSAAMHTYLRDEFLNSFFDD